MNTEKQEASHHDYGAQIVNLSSIKCPRALDFDAPLLSTRRSLKTRSNLVNPTNSINSIERVPFSWEQSPGKPKQRDLYRVDLIVPPPKLPPARWHDQMIIDQNLRYSHDFASASAFASEEDDVDAFSGAIDVFSLGESTRDGRINDDIDDDEHGGVINDCVGSPNFILKRFLSDANALAISSSIALQDSSNTDFGGGQGVHEPKGCGIDFLLPCKAVKLKHCSFKSSVRENVNGINMNLSPRKWNLGRKIMK